MSKQAQQLLDELETALQETDLWCLEAPSEEALASRAPFCCDTMPLEQWLQFVFIPNVRLLLAAGRPLPGTAAISPLAELVYANKLADVAAVITTLKRLEHCLNQP